MEVVEATSTVDWKENPFTFKMFTRVEHYEYNLAKGNGEHLLVIAYTKWRGNLKKTHNITYKIAYPEWQAVLSVSYNKAVDTIKECEAFIEKITGAYYKDEGGQWKQETNEYLVKKPTLDVKEIEKKAKVMNAHEKFAEKVTDLRYKFDDNILKQINDYGTKWKMDGYTAWVVTDCPILKEAGKNKFEILENKGQGWVKGKLEKEYDEKQREQSAIKHVEALAKKHETELNGEVEIDMKSQKNLIILLIKIGNLSNKKNKERKRGVTSPKSSRRRKDRVTGGGKSTILLTICYLYSVISD